MLGADVVTAESQGTILRLAEELDFPGMELGGSCMIGIDTEYQTFMMMWRTATSELSDRTNF